MKQLSLWLALILALGIAAVLAVVHFEPASSALKRSVRPGPLAPGHAYLGDRCSSCHESNVGVTVARCTACHASDEPPKPRTTHSRTSGNPCPIRSGRRCWRTRVEFER